MIINYYKKMTGGNLLLTMDSIDLTENIFHMATEMPLKSMNTPSNEKSSINIFEMKPKTDEL